MIEAGFAFLIGCAAARWLLWPLQMALAARRARRLRADIERLRTDIKTATRS